MCMAFIYSFIYFYFFTYIFTSYFDILLFLFFFFTYSELYSFFFYLPWNAFKGKYHPPSSIFALGLNAFAFYWFSNKRGPLFICCMIQLHEHINYYTAWIKKSKKSLERERETEREREREREIYYFTCRPINILASLKWIACLPFILLLHFLFLA